MFKLWMPLFASTIFTLGATSASAADTIELTIEGLRNSDGRVYASLCDTQTCYEAHKGFLQEKKLNAQAGDMVVRFDGLKAGEYTILMFHDEDGDGQFDKNFIGFPEEGFGISNDVQPVFSQPAWESAAIKFDGSVLRTSIRVRYW